MKKTSIGKAIRKSSQRTNTKVEFFIACDEAST